jgi:hypothetical protein
MKPQRIQLSRRKGWRMPPDTINAARPGLLGNPFPVDIYGQQGAVDLNRRWLLGPMSARELSGLSRCDRWSDPPVVSLVILRTWVLEKLKAARGKNMGCWCGLGEQCHVDTLLEIANQ